MFTEQSLHQYPALVKAFTGIAPDQFWELIEQITDRFEDYQRRQRARSDRQRAQGAGRPNDLPLVIRTVTVLTYLRLHIPQITVAALFGVTQSDLSRDLRRLLPLIQECLPCPVVWEVRDQTEIDAEFEQLSLNDLSQGRVLIDATEQRVSRPQNNAKQKEYFSGKKHMHTLKTQFVTDGEHQIKAISDSVPGAGHDKALCDKVQTLDRLPDGCEADADKGYQGLAGQVSLVEVQDPSTGEKQMVPRLRVQTPYKKPKGKELSEEQKAFNRALNTIRIRVEHCIGWAKNWAILATRFRCDHSIYTSIMRTICGLVNWQTERWQARKANCA